MRFTCTEKMLAYYLCSPNWPWIRGTIIQLCRKEPALWQVTRGTIIQLCRKEPVIGKITHHHHHHRRDFSGLKLVRLYVAYEVVWRVLLLCVVLCTRATLTTLLSLLFLLLMFYPRTGPWHLVLIAPFFPVSSFDPPDTHGVYRPWYYPQFLPIEGAHGSKSFFSFRATLSWKFIFWVGSHRPSSVD